MFMAHSQNTYKNYLIIYFHVSFSFVVGLAASKFDSFGWRKCFLVFSIHLIIFHYFCAIAASCKKCVYKFFILNVIFSSFYLIFVYFLLFSVSTIIIMLSSGMFFVRPWIAYHFVYRNVCLFAFFMIVAKMRNELVIDISLFSIFVKDFAFCLRHQRVETIEQYSSFLISSQPYQKSI